MQLLSAPLLSLVVSARVRSTRGASLKAPVRVYLSIYFCRVLAHGFVDLETIFPPSKSKNSTSYPLQRKIGKRRKQQKTQAKMYFPPFQFKVFWGQR